MIQYIPQLQQLDTTSEPLTTEWKGYNAHIGPVQTVTKLVNMLSGKTTCATVSMMSGVLLWGAQRLHPFVKGAPLENADFLYEMAEAMFAWQHHWMYLDSKQLPKSGFNNRIDQPVQDSASIVLLQFAKKNMKEKHWNSFYQPIMDLSHMIHTLRFVEAENTKKEFTTWLKKLCTRLDDLAKAPDLEVPVFSDFESEEAYDAYCAPRRGMPLPPSVLNTEIDISTLNLQQEAQQFLSTLDYTKNRYLRSPEAMKAMGFEGEPYGIA